MLEKMIQEHLACFRRVSENQAQIVSAGELLADALKRGNKILICGNGGSAADSQHFAAEIIGRFENERNAWPAIALTTDTSVLTAVANDYAYERIFQRQVEGLGRKRDVLIGVSTSGNSLNIINAVNAAREKGMITIALTGKEGGRLIGAADTTVVIPYNVTARIQEAHSFILHYWAGQVETSLSSQEN